MPELNIVLKKNIKVERQIMRNKWDSRFLDMASLVASWSKDPSTKAGAVIVRPDNTVASVGFNGFPKQLLDTPEMYEDRETKYSRIVHAEINAQIHAREPLQGFTLYTTPFMCCDRCVVQMIQAGISRFVFPRASDEALTRWEDSFGKTLSYLNESGVEWTELT